MSWRLDLLGNSKNLQTLDDASSTFVDLQKLSIRWDDCKYESRLVGAWTMASLTRPACKLLPMHVGRLIGHSSP